MRPAINKGFVRFFFFSRGVNSKRKHCASEISRFTSVYRMAQKLLDTRFLLLGSIGFRATLYKYNIYSRPHVSYHLALVRVATPTRSKAMARPRFQATSVVMYDLSTGSGADTFRIFLFVNAYLWLIYGSFATCYCTRVQFLCAFGRRFGVCKPKM